MSVPLGQRPLPDFSPPVFTPAASIVGFPLIANTLVLYLAFEHTLSSGAMAFLTAVATFSVTLLLAVRLGRRWAVIIPASICVPLALSWFDIYAAADLYSPHAGFYSWAFKRGLPSRFGLIPYALWLAVTAFLGAKAAGDKDVKSYVRERVL